MAASRRKSAVPRPPSPSSPALGSSPQASSTAFTSENCYRAFRSLVRVRPFVGKECTYIPAEQIVPRPALDYSPEEMSLTVLDPAAKFKPKKNGMFPNMHVIWSFEDPESIEQQHPRQLQADVYAKACSPLTTALQEGYSCLYVCYGAANSGKNATMWGDEWSGGNRGLFPRFAEDVFDLMKEQLRENASFTIELEAVEIVNEAYVDLLATKKVAGDLKVREDPNEGLVLQGLTRKTVANSEELIAEAQKAIKLTKKKKNTHFLTLRIVETYKFKDPHNPDVPETNKRRRMSVSFAVLRNVTGLTRCMDVAIERDSGENPSAKPPTRDGPFTKLFAPAWTGFYNTTFINCVSPYCNDAKDTLNTLMFAKKITRIKTTPQLIHDSDMLELRSLADEMKDLGQSVQRTVETQHVVQNELDRLQNDIELAEITNAGLTEDLEVEGRIQAAMKLFRTREVGYMNKEAAAADEAATIRQGEVDDLKTDIKATLRETDTLRKEEDEINGRMAVHEKEKDRLKALNEPFESELQFYVDEVKQVEEKEEFIANAPGEQQEKVAGLVARTNQLRKDAKELAENEAVAKEDLKRVESQHAVVKDEHASSKQLATKLSQATAKEAEIANLQKEISRMEQEIQRMEEEIKNKPGGCCAVM